MQTFAPPDAPLSPHWAFVVQLRQGTALTPQGLHGRVEHIVSGRAVYFTGLEELGAFLAQVLAPGAPQHTPIVSMEEPYRCTRHKEGVYDSATTSCTRAALGPLDRHPELSPLAPHDRLW